MTAKLIKLYLTCLVLVLIAVTIPTYAQTQEDKTLSPYFFVNGDPAVDHLPLKDTRVEIGVSGVIADVRVVQTYRNEGSRPINATYIFPASTRAAVYSMRMRIGDQVIFAKIKEREAAKQEFEVAKKEGKSASLLEENRPNVFSMKLANVMPQDQIEIELRYTELLVPTDGLYEVVYPTVVGPRYPSPEECQWCKNPSRKRPISSSGRRWDKHASHFSKDLGRGSDPGSALYVASDHPRMARDNRGPVNARRFRSVSGKS